MYYEATNSPCVVGNWNKTLWYQNFNMYIFHGLERNNWRYSTRAYYSIHNVITQLLDLPSTDYRNASEESTIVCSLRIRLLFLLCNKHIILAKLEVELEVCRRIFSKRKWPAATAVSGTKFLRQIISISSSRRTFYSCLAWKLGSST